MLTNITQLLDYFVLIIFIRILKYFYSFKNYITKILKGSACVRFCTRLIHFHFLYL